MKHTMILPLLLLSVTLWAQNQSGQILYEEKIQVELGEDVEGMQEMEGMDEIMKQLRESMGASQKVLLFSGSESLYTSPQNSPTKEASWSSSGADGDMEIEMVVMRPESQTYQNQESREVIKQEEVFGKKFLIQSDLSKQTWKMTGKHEEVLGYPCQQAIFEDGTTTIVAWFTPQIPVSLGPNGYGQLPGMILKLDIDNGRMIIAAKEVNLKDVDEALINAPKQGKKVSQEEYDRITAEKTKEMQDLYGGQGGSVIQIDVDER